MSPTLAHAFKCRTTVRLTFDSHKTYRQLREQNMQLEEEGSAKGFWVIDIKHNKEAGRITLTQIVLTDQIIKALGCESCDHLPSVTAPTDTIILKDEDGDPGTGDINCASVIGAIW